MNQYNIFGDIDKINPDEKKINYCSWCKKPIDTDVSWCSNECARKIIEKYFPQ